MNLAALRSRNFLYFAGGNTLASTGVWMQRATIGWISWEMTHAASYVGLISFLFFMPAVVTGPLFGVLIDRVGVKRMAMVAQTIIILLSIILLFCVVFDLLTTFLLAVIALMLGFNASAMNPAHMSMAPRLVSRDNVASVVTISATYFHLTRLSGPVMAGWIIVTKGVEYSLLIQVILMLPFLVILAFVEIRNQDSTNGKESFLKALLSGVLFALHNRVIQNAFVLSGATAFVIRGVLEILPVVAGGVFDRGSVGLGILISASALGGLSAGAAKTLLPAQSDNELPRAVPVVALFGMMLVPVLGSVTAWPVVIGLIFAMGFCMAFTGISMQTATQMTTGDDYRGRVMSLWMLMLAGAAALGSLTLGFVIDLIGFASTLLLTGFGAVSLLAFIVLRVWR